jgi:S1-C subfamily serine protease
VVRRATRITVKLADGREFEATPVASTARSDLAMLKIDVPKGTRFQSVEFAKAGDLLLGESVIALGNPFGLGGSVSRGILSSKQRRAPREGEKLDIANWLQTDAAINPGNSGGPLINLDGELIGISVAIHRQGQGIGFAIPIKQVNDALSDFFTPERMRGLWLGARVKSGREGLTVTSTEPGGPAAEAGLRAGDRIVSVNGREVMRLLDWGHAIAKKMKLMVKRAARQREILLQLRPEEDFFNATLVRKRLGLTVDTLTEGLARRLRLGFAGGFVVMSVEEDGPADLAGLKTGYVIQSIENQSPRTMVELARIVYGLRGGDRARLTVMIEKRSGNFIQRRQAVAEVMAR